MNSINNANETRAAKGNGVATNPVPSLPAKGGKTSTTLGPTGDSSRTKSEQLKYYENIVTEFLDHEDKVADAIYQIKVRKLYKETRQNFQDYVRARWDISRSRANQLIQFVKEKEKALANGELPPANERAARKMRAGSSSGDYEQSRKKSITHIDRTLDRLPLDKRAAYVSELMRHLQQLSQRLRAMSTSGVTPPAADRTGQTAATPVSEPAWPEADLPEPVLPEMTLPVAAVANTATTSPMYQSTEGLISCGATTPMTIDEARARGFIKKN